MMTTVPHVISGLGLRKFQADGFLLTRVYVRKNVYSCVCMCVCVFVCVCYVWVWT